MVVAHPLADRIVNRNDPQTPKMRYKVGPSIRLARLVADDCVQIKDVSRQSARTLTFKDESGKTTNVAAYFQTVLNVNLRGADFPCVQLTKTAWYPLELCTIQSGNKFTKKLDPDQISEALKFTTNPPHIRIQQVKDGLQTLGYASNPICRAWGFSIDPTPIEFAARVLPPPSLHCQEWVLPFSHENGNVAEVEQPQRQADQDPGQSRHV